MKTSIIDLFKKTITVPKILSWNDFIMWEERDLWSLRVLYEIIFISENGHCQIFRPIRIKTAELNLHNK